MERTPHPEEPAEGALGAGDPDDDRRGTTGPHDGDPAHIPAHNTAPDGFTPDDRGAPLGGDEGTEDQLDADNPTEKDTLKSLDPDDSPA